MSRLQLLGAALALALAVTSSAAVADVIVVGRVVKTDRREIYLNLGGGAGVEVGARLRLKHPITLRHPVTRKPVTDWLPLGDGTVTAVGDQLARIALPPELLQAVQVGDVAEIYVERDEAQPVAPPPPPPAPDAPPLPTVDADTAAVLQVWRTTSGGTLEVRIAAWTGWLASHADSPHADAVRADLEVLRATQLAMAPDVPGRPRTLELHVEHALPTRADAGASVALAFVLVEPEQVVAASLHVRAVGDTGFERIELAREHGIYLRGTIPGALVAAPGVEYFVEALAADGTATAAYGSDRAPARIAVAPPPVMARFAPTRRRTQLTMIGSYLDFATFDRRTDGSGARVDHTDHFAQAEIDVRYRLDGMLTGVRLGFGSYGGRGGFSERAWSDANRPPVIGFQYGYVEGELRLPLGRRVPPLGIAGRFIAGVGREGFGLGGEGRLRLGELDRTNLSVGLSAVEQVGFLTEMRLETWPRPELPIGLAVAVTDQPGNGDLGVRLSTDVGYRVRPWVRPTVRVSYQGRTATHAGLGGGVGLVFDW